MFVIALCIALGKPALKDSFRLYKIFGGVQTAVIRLDEANDESLIRFSKLRVGWLNCHIREHAEDARYYRCQGYGHVSQTARERGAEVLLISEQYR